jgi:23S rRNA (adenine2503-C2)-methyltransferase
MTKLLKPILGGLKTDELKALTAQAGEASFRARQLTEWVYRRQVTDPALMTNLPVSLKDYIAQHTIPCSSEVTESLKSSDGTEKLLIRLHDGECVEMVMIPSTERMTFCLSTQVGCPVRCRFCASGADGLVRNLEPGEIIEELHHGIHRLGKLPDNIVFMGIGEGLLNFKNLSTALDIISAPDMIGMSPRRITVSTSGYVPGIRQLADFGRPFTLAVSLHAVDDATRAEIIPDQLRYDIRDILDACTYYREKIGRMVTLEYTLLAGVNDSEGEAEKLAAIARSQHAKVNLIPYNAVSEAFKRPSKKTIMAFFNKLEQRGATVTLRLEKGAENDAACGQLRLKRKNGL